MQLGQFRRKYCQVMPRYCPDIAPKIALEMSPNLSLFTGHYCSAFQKENPQVFLLGSSVQKWLRFALKKLRNYNFHFDNFVCR